MNELLNDQDWGRLRDKFLVAEPFNHVIIDNFWNDETAKKLVSEFSVVKGKKVVPFNGWDSDLTEYLDLYNDLAAK